MGQAIGGLRRIFDSWAGWRTRWLGASVRATLDQHIAELPASKVQLTRRIEELEAAKLQAEAASKAKSDFLANMSHELRTPLNAIIGFSDLMQSEVLGPIGSDTYRGYVSDIHFSGCHLLEIINDILEVVRHESGKMELKEDTVPVEDLIADALRLIRPQAREAQVNLNWRPAATALPELRCDRVRVRQILLNVLSNAVKFTEPGGCIDIKTKVSSGFELIVRDNGIGIRPEDIARILTPSLRPGRFGLFAQPGHRARADLDQSFDRAPWRASEPLQRARSRHHGAAVFPGRPACQEAGRARRGDRARRGRLTCFGRALRPTGPGFESLANPSYSPAILINRSRRAPFCSPSAKARICAA